MNHIASPVPPEGDPYMRLLQIILDQQEKILDKVDRIEESQTVLRREVTDHIEREEKLFSTALPAGDAESHRRAHEAWIEEQVEAKAIRRAVREKIFAGVAWAAIVAMGAAVWAYLQSHLKP